MFALFLRDLAVMRIPLLLGVPGYLLMASCFYQEASGFIFVTVVFTLLLALGVNMIDDKQRTDAFFCSLPISRSAIVRGRYCTSILAIALGTILFAGFGPLLNGVLGGHDSIPAGSWTAIPVFLAVPVLFVSLFYPIYFRLGFGTGAMIAGMVLLVSFVGLIDVLYAAVHPAGDSVSASTCLNPVAALISGVGTLAQTTGLPLFLALVLLISGTILFSSMALSVRFFRTRDL